jgi:adenine phosphoribosyltransferase
MQVDIEAYIRTIPDYPKPGIEFRDITTLLADPVGFREAVDAMVKVHAVETIDHVVGIEARGFILGGAMAHQLSAGFVPVRKKGKLPGETLEECYDLEYGSDTLEIHVGALKKGDRVLLVDDLLATGGTAEAAVKLIERLGARVIACSFVIDLPDLGGRARLENLGKEVLSLCQFTGK